MLQTFLKGSICSDSKSAVIGRCPHLSILTFDRELLHQTDGSVFWSGLMIVALFCCHTEIDFISLPLYRFSSTSCFVFLIYFVFDLFNMQQRAAGRIRTMGLMLSLHAWSRCSIPHPLLVFVLWWSEIVECCCGIKSIVSVHRWISKLSEAAERGEEINTEGQISWCYVKELLTFRRVTN